MAEKFTLTFDPEAIRAGLQQAYDTLNRAFNLIPLPEGDLPPLIGVGGLKEHRKDEFADALVARAGYMKTFMSEPLHQALLILDPIITYVPERSEDERRAIAAELGSPHHERASYGRYERYSELVERVGYTAAKQNMEVRRLLQKLGTEVGRNMLGEEVWTDIAEEKIREARAAGSPVVITGIRYQNEIDLVRELGGWTVWIERTAWPVKESHPLTDAIDAALQDEEPSSTDTHSSETSLTADDFDIVIENDSTLEALAEKAEALAAELKNKG
jgi:hypothetical protein